MSDAEPGTAAARATAGPAGGTGRLGRILLACALTIAWLVSVPFMWKAVSTVPSAARLQAMQSRIMHVPSPATFLRTTGRSFLELAGLLLLLWPGWRRLWLVRLLVAFLALAAWAVLTMPLELTELEWVHHRWLVGSDILLMVALVVTVTARIVGAVQRARSRRTARE